MRKRTKAGIVAALVGVFGLVAVGAFVVDRLGIDVIPPSPQAYALGAVDSMAAGIQASAENLAQARSEVESATADAHSYADTYDAIAEAAALLGGPHSAFYDPAEAQVSFAATDSGSQAQTPTVNTINGVTTVIVPSLPSNDPDVTDSYESALSEGIANAESQTSCGYVIDLQGNGGGNVWPMLTGLSSLIDDGQVLSFVYADRSAQVEIAAGQVTLDGRVMGTSVSPISITKPVVVLIDGGTGSSAEAVAIALTGQDGVTFVGEPSYGFSTANEPIRLYDGAIVNLTIGIDADRNGTQYGQPLQPDVEAATGLSSLDTARHLLSTACE